MANRVLVALAVALAITDLAFAHAVLLKANPTPHGLVAGPDIDIELQFNSRIDSTRSRLTLVLPDHTTRSVSLQQASTPASLGARLTGLSTGEYILRWQVLAADGHITRGEIPFQVK
jgi:methionine-rich copper-binding protein CopC